MAWVLLLIAGLLEVVWAIGFKALDARSPAWMYLGTYTALFVSFALLVKALRDLPVGTAYAVWTGIGAVGVALMGIVIFGESAQPSRLLFIALIVVGIIGLKLSDAA
ncbi:MAG: SMR family transporter [Myxococcota bacterium]